MDAVLQNTILRQKAQPFNKTLVEEAVHGDRLHRLECISGQLAQTSVGSRPELHIVRAHRKV